MQATKELRKHARCDFFILEKILKNYSKKSLQYRNGMILYNYRKEIRQERKAKDMKNTIKIKVINEREYKEFVEMLINKGFEQIGTRLFEDNKSYVRVTVE